MTIKPTNPAIPKRSKDPPMTYAGDRGPRKVWRDGMATYKGEDCPHTKEYYDWLRRNGIANRLREQARTEEKRV